MDDIQSQKIIAFTNQYNYLMLEFTKLLFLGKDVLDDLNAGKMINDEEIDYASYEKLCYVLLKMTKSAEILVSVADFDKDN
jgi:hypothetical protein